MAHHMGKLRNTPLIGLPHACAYDFENRAQLIELIQFRFQRQIKKRENANKSFFFKKTTKHKNPSTRTKITQSSGLFLKLFYSQCPI